MANEPRYAVELKAGEEFGAFQGGDQAVELTRENPVWETTVFQDYYRVRDLPFLKDLGEVSKSKKGGDA